MPLTWAPRCCSGSASTCRSRSGAVATTERASARSTTVWSSTSAGSRGSGSIPPLAPSGSSRAAPWPTSTTPRIAFGLALPTGVAGSTGIAGLALGGGIGNLSRAYGLTIDNLIEADVVLASGELVTTDAERHPDLFWALRGGGGNFGIVTSFLFRLHPVANVVGGPVFWGLDQAADVLRWYRDFIREAPPELNGWFAFVTVPPVPVFPEHLHGQKMAAIIWCWCGPLEDAEAAFAPVKAFGPPALYGVQEMPLPALQRDVRSPVSRWIAVAVAGRLPHGDLGRGDRRARSIRCPVADRAFNDASLSDDRSRP